MINVSREEVLCCIVKMGVKWWDPATNLWERRQFHFSASLFPPLPCHLLLLLIISINKTKINSSLFVSSLFNWIKSIFSSSSIIFPLSLNTIFTEKENRNFKAKEKERERWMDDVCFLFFWVSQNSFQFFTFLNLMAEGRRI